MAIAQILKIGNACIVGHMKRTMHVQWNISKGQCTIHKVSCSPSGLSLFAYWHHSTKEASQAPLHSQPRSSVSLDMLQLKHMESPLYLNTKPSAAGKQHSNGPGMEIITQDFLALPYRTTLKNV